MVLMGLLLLALIFVVVGVVLASLGWLIAALVASVAAAALLLRSSLQTRQRARRARSASSAPADAAVANSAAAAPATPQGSGPLGRATGAGETAVPPDTQVWVVDGYPEYHVENCAELHDLAAEAVPYHQAVEDGFQPCVVCDPDRALRPTALGAPPAPPVPRQVLVIDGFPDYHVAGCRMLLGHEPVAIPLEQAVEDGFSPCDVCEPDATDGSAGGGPGQEHEVWVVDGRPDYHRAGCAQLSGLPAEAIPHEQAVEDGFAECPVCTPESGHAPEGAPAQVWVVDGYPNYHRAGCAELSGLPAEAIPHDQAVEDGFGPCSVCRPSDENGPPDASGVRPEPDPGETQPGEAAESRAGEPEQ